MKESRLIKVKVHDTTLKADLIMSAVGLLAAAVLLITGA